MPPAALVEETDLLKIGTCAIGWTLLIASFMTRGPRKGDPWGSSGLVSALTLLVLLGKKHLKQAGISALNANVKEGWDLDGFTSKLIRCFN